MDWAISRIQFLLWQNLFGLVLGGGGSESCLTGQPPLSYARVEFAFSAPAPNLVRRSSAAIEPFDRGALPRRRTFRSETDRRHEFSPHQNIVNKISLNRDAWSARGVIGSVHRSHLIANLKKVLCWEESCGSTLSRADARCEYVVFGVAGNFSFSGRAALLARSRPRA